MATDDDSSWSRQLLVGFGALLAAALVVGGVLSIVALGAAKVTGLDGGAGAGASVKPSLYLPPLTSTTSAAPSPEPSAATRAAAPSPSAKPSAKPTKRKPDLRISLQAFPTQVGAGQRIDLTGVYPRGEGAVLQVQRWQGGWSDFPVTTSVSGGQFHTWVQTGQSGRQQFRVLDRASGKHSNPVSVTVS
ncbi:MAG: hypothetical protein ACXVW6_04325 [Nocardioidaceae bacterium]